jgi:3-oxoisoapionate-4-phosphate transcarboxylase/hydrolase
MVNGGDKMSESLEQERDRYVIVTYYIETPLELYDAALLIAAVQSIGAGKISEHDCERLAEVHGAKVVEVNPISGDYTQKLPARAVSRRKTIRAANITIAYPHINFGPKMPNLLSAIAGELFEMNSFTAAKVMDIEFPDSYLKHFTGPRFGIEGCRDILKLYNRPVIGAIVKPCVGLSAGRLAELAEEGFSGGLDFIKDDELLADAVYNSIKDRVKKVTAAMKRAEERTGEKKMYAFNITDRIDRLRELHDIVVEGGGKCLMINVATVGMEAMRELAEYTKVPIHCHRTFAAVWARSPFIGISFPALTKIFRLCGADQIHCGAIQGKLYEPDDEVLLNMRACTSETAYMKRALPVSSGGQWAGKAPVNAEVIGHNDFIHLSGAGTYSHPDGAAAGARSIRQAWDAVLRGIPLHEYAKDHRELSRAIAFFGTA